MRRIYCKRFQCIFFPKGYAEQKLKNYIYPCIGDDSVYGRCTRRVHGILHPRVSAMLFSDIIEIIAVDKIPSTSGSLQNSGIQNNMFMSQDLEQESFKFS